MKKRVAIYARVSTADQNLDNQLDCLRKFCELRDWDVVQTFSDFGVSGSVENRKGITELMNWARKRKIDIVLVWHFDRFARSTKQLVTAFEEFRTLGVDFVSYQNNIDTTTPVGKLTFDVMAAISEFERSMIRSRIKTAMDRIKISGKTKSGKAIGRPKAGLYPVYEYLKENSGASPRELIVKFNIKRTSAYKIIREAKNGMVRNSQPGTQETSCAQVSA